MKKFILALTVVSFLLSVQPAEAFPTRPITIFNSSSPGSPTDMMARQMAHYSEQQQHFAQPFVIETRAGGAGGVMFAALLAEPADGYTIASSNASQLAALQAQLAGQFAFEDFDFLANVQVDYFCLVVRADSPFYTIDDVVEAVRRGEDVSWGGQGTGSSLHLVALRIAEQAGFGLTWLPFLGGADSTVNLLGGHVDVIFVSPVTLWPHVEAGTVRIIALSSEERSSILPEIPTLREHGYDIVMSQWRGFIARRGIPEDRRAMIIEAIRNSVHEPGYQEFLAQNVVAFGYMELDEFEEFARADFDSIAEFSRLLD